MQRIPVSCDHLSAYSVNIPVDGRIRLSEEKRVAVRKAVKIIRRIAPDAEIAFAAALEMDGSDIVGAHLREHDAYRTTILLSTSYDAAEIVSTAHHEAYHRCERLMTNAEKRVMGGWSRKMEALPMPPNLVLGEAWWSKPSERAAWAFENYVHLKNGSEDRDLANFMGFCLSREDFPDTVVSVYESVLSGKIGLRAIQNPAEPKTHEIGFLKRCIMTFLGGFDRRAA
jgi:hypothetical protein